MPLPRRFWLGDVGGTPASSIQRSDVDKQRPFPDTNTALTCWQAEAKLNKQVRALQTCFAHGHAIQPMLLSPRKQQSLTHSSEPSRAYRLLKPGGLCTAIEHANPHQRLSLIICNDAPLTAPCPAYPRSSPPLPPNNGQPMRMAGVLRSKDCFCRFELCFPYLRHFLRGQFLPPPPPPKKTFLFEKPLVLQNRSRPKTKTGTPLSFFHLHKNVCFYLFCSVSAKMAKISLRK